MQGVATEQISSIIVHTLEAHWACVRPRDLTVVINNRALFWHWQPSLDDPYPPSQASYQSPISSHADIQLDDETK